MNNSKFLKIKVKSLAAESRFIRKEENKLKTVKYKTPEGKVKIKRVPIKPNFRDQHQQLYLHRMGLRRSSRNSLIAYAFLRNKPYETVRPKNKFLVNRAEIARMVKKYGPVDEYLNGASPEVMKLLELLYHWFKGKPVVVD